jgi:hypothetical protein
MKPSSIPALLIAVGSVLLAPGLVSAQCPEEPQLQNYTGGGQVVCPCFIEGEHAGAIFDLPPSEFPIEIVKVGIGWGSQFGGQGSQLEDSINLYEGGLPDPGAPTFTFNGPQLTDGFINEFDLTTQGGNRVINSSPFTVTLRFLNDSTPLGPSVVHDGNGCQVGKNIVFDKNNLSWKDGCTLGIGGDWVFYVIYRKVNCGGGTGAGAVPDGRDIAGVPMTALREANNDVTLSWEASCSSDATDYNVYEGALGSFYSHFSKVCSTGGATTATITPAAGGRYFIVVPTDGTNEGSYGRDSSGMERPTGGGACLLQQPPSCP